MGDKFRVLIADKLPPAAVEILQREPEIQAEAKTGMTPDELKAVIGNYHGIVVRSATRLTADVLERAANLRAICRAGVGVDNVDIDAASLKGIVVMNTPSGNTVSTAEHSIAMLLALARNIPRACESLRAGKWDRKSFTGTQLAGKTIGVIGLGRVGLEVGRRCKAMGMTVVGYDPYISRARAEENQVELCELDEIYKRSDFITVHTPLTDETRGLIGKAQFGKMKPGVRLLNCARGGIIDEKALAEAIRSRKVGGAAIDVFSSEPPTDRELIELDQVVATPHLGASTEEAEFNVAIDAAKQMADALLDRGIVNAVNFPALDTKEAARLRPFCLLAEKIGTLQRQLIEGQLKSAAITYYGELAKADVGPVTRSVTVGLLRPVLEENVNLVNAPMLAQARGIDVSETKSSEPTDFAALVSVKVSTNQRDMTIDGTVFGRADPRIVSIDGYRVEVVPRGDVLILFDEDRPGLIGAIGTLLGKSGVNISCMTFGRKQAGGDAITVLNIDGPVSAELLDQVRRVPNVVAAHVVRL
jgi:D-3-phosphoglycerate dehydrogenase